MITWGRMVLAVLLLGMAIYTVSYGIWTWKSKNKLGAIMVCMLALVVLALPLYIAFFIR